MSERRDDTTERAESSPPESERQPGSYYYDDATGYELYDPAREQHEQDEQESIEPRSTEE
jgi:hypothetical protein